ncbi:MAG: ribonuclease E inhibitor RraB [Limisphaerales bacterium]
MITRQQILDFFDHTRQLKREGRAHYDIDQVCRWSYFVIDTDREKLTRAGRHLEQHGYQVIGFLEPAPDDDDQGTIYLRFDKIEYHTPDSLITRNAEFYKLAADFDLVGYDGMDVGAVDGP